MMDYKDLRLQDEDLIVQWELEDSQLASAAASSPNVFPLNPPNSHEPNTTPSPQRPSMIPFHQITLVRAPLKAEELEPELFKPEPVQIFPFLKLPAEIRNMVYEHISKQYHHHL